MEVLTCDDKRVHRKRYHECLIAEDLAVWGTEFEKVAKRAVQGLWAHRSRLGLVGGHINVFTSEWTHKVHSIS
jgi:hypothetical protein